MAGANVTINGRTKEKTQAAVERLMERTGRSHVQGIAADLSTAKGAESLVEKLPKVDVLINNLGQFEQVPFVEISDSQWESMFQVNVMSGVRLSRAYLNGMLESNSGRILFISSECAEMIPEDMIHYGTTKTAQVAIARGLAELTKGTKVTVNSILPGPTRTEGVDQFIKQMSAEKAMDEEEVVKDFFQEYRPSSLIQRFADPVEVANTVLYFASPLASATNGAAIRVDGGTVRSLF
jgi:NAD(P)-dependent dehydrogenase (short-subunit alcohol dehydrogenase family)